MCHVKYKYWPEHSWHGIMQTLQSVISWPGDSCILAPEFRVARLCYENPVAPSGEDRRYLSLPRSASLPWLEENARVLLYRYKQPTKPPFSQFYRSNFTFWVSHCERRRSQLKPWSMLAAKLRWSGVPLAVVDSDVS